MTWTEEKEKERLKPIFDSKFFSPIRQAMELTMVQSGEFQRRGIVALRNEKSRSKGLWKRYVDILKKSIIPNTCFDKANQTTSSSQMDRASRRSQRPRT